MAQARRILSSRKNRVVGKRWTGGTTGKGTSSVEICIFLNGGESRRVMGVIGGDVGRLDYGVRLEARASVAKEKWIQVAFAERHT